MKKGGSFQQNRPNTLLDSLQIDLQASSSSAASGSLTSFFDLGLLAAFLETGLGASSSSSSSSTVSLLCEAPSF
jgi:hypothetical protein